MEFYDPDTARSEQQAVAEDREEHDVAARRQARRASLSPSQYGWLQAARIPLVVALLTGPNRFMRSLARPLSSLDMRAVWAAWAPAVVLALAAAVLIVAGRNRRHHPATLAVEGVTAAVLGFVPPVQWIVWFGFSGIIGSTFAFSGLVDFVQPLGIAWLATIMVTAAKQRRNAERNSVERNTG